MSANQSLRPGSLGGLKIRKASDTKSNATDLFYGEGGTGKTTLVASAADVEALCPVLHLNVENGADSIASRDNIEVVDIDSIRELQAVYLDLYNGKHKDYRTVILDNLTESQAQGMEDILQSGKVADFVDFNGATFANGAWNRSSEQMRKLVRGFRDLNVYTIFVAWEKNYADEGPPDIGPAFTKTIGKEIPGMVNGVYRLSVKGEDRVLQTSRTDRVSAKDRSQKLPAIIRNPTMTVLNDFWTGKTVKPEPTASAPKSPLAKKR